MHQKPQPWFRLSLIHIWPTQQCKSVTHRCRKQWHNTSVRHDKPRTTLYSTCLLYTSRCLLCRGVPAYGTRDGACNHREPHVCLIFIYRINAKTCDKYPQSICSITYLGDGLRGVQGSGIVNRIKRNPGKGASYERADYRYHICLLYTSRCV